MLKSYNADFIRTYFTIVRDLASSLNPIHRAKAMKLAINTKEEFNALLNRDARENFWKSLNEEGWVHLNSMGYIESLEAKALDFLGR